MGTGDLIWPQKRLSCGGLACAAGLLATGWLAGCADGPGTADSKPPPTSDVGRMEAWHDAEMIRGSDPDRFTLLGSGESMLPVYGENTVLVISKVNYDELATGMKVVYVTRGGMRVLHVLLEKDSDGWRVQGLNNEIADRERVTRYNLLGVVYASFPTDGTGRK